MATDRSKELAAYLSVPRSGEKPKKYRGERPYNWRQVYKADKSDEWFLTHSRDLPRHAPFARRDVAALLAAGLIEPTWPGSDVADLAFSPTPALFSRGEQ